MAGHGQGDDVGSDAKLALSQVLAGGGRQLKDRSYAPDQLCGLLGESKKVGCMSPKP